MRVALCQLPVSSDPAVNLGRARAAIAYAAAAGASLAVFPEGLQARFGTDLPAVAEATDGPFGQGLSQAAAEHGVAVVAGVFEPAPGGRVYNTAVVFDAAGRPAAAYRKIHLFDALGQRESDQVAAGHEPVVIDLAGLRVGVLICYDIRFPEHARALATRGQCDLIVVPAGWATRAFFALAENNDVLVRGLEADDEDLEELFHRVLAESPAGQGPATTVEKDSEHWRELDPGRGA